MALNTRCQTCRGLLGPEDIVGDVTHPALCLACRDRAAEQEAKDAAKNHPAAVKGRRLKALAMAEVIDANFRHQFPQLDPFDQAGRILLASRGWTEAKWMDIGETALMPNGEHYERKEISDETKNLVREIYEGRSKAPLATRRAS